MRLEVLEGAQKEKLGTDDELTLPQKSLQSRYEGEGLVLNGFVDQLHTVEIHW